MTSQNTPNGTPNPNRDDLPALLSALRANAACREIVTGVKFVNTDNVISNGVKVQTWVSGNITATVTRFENCMSLISITDGKRHEQVTANLDIDGAWLAYVWTQSEVA